MLVPLWERRSEEKRKKWQPQNERQTSSCCRYHQEYTCTKVSVADSKKITRFMVGSHATASIEFRADFYRNTREDCMEVLHA